MSKSAPATPDYTGAAQATAQSSADITQAQTFANRPTVTTPWSQQTWQATPTWDPVTGTYVDQWASNTNLTPDAQSALDSQLGVSAGLSSTAKGLLGQNASQINAPVDWSKFTPTGATPTAGNYQAPTLQNSISTSGLPQVGSANSYANTAADAAWQQYQNRTQPIQQRQQDQLRTQLYNSGLREGDTAYDQAMKTLSQNQGDQNTNASLAATQTGIQGGATLQGLDLANNVNQFGQRVQTGTFANQAADQTLANQVTAGSTGFGQQLSAANYQDQLRQQQISEDLQSRGFTINEINALLNGQQVNTGPTTQFNAAGSSQPVNALGAATDAYGAAANASNVANANTSGAVGAAGTAASIAAIAI